MCLFIFGRGLGIFSSVATASIFDGSGNKLVIFSQTRSIAFLADSCENNVKSKLNHKLFLFPTLTGVCFLKNPIRRNIVFVNWNLCSNVVFSTFFKPTLAVDEVIFLLPLRSTKGASIDRTKMLLGNSLYIFQNGQKFWYQVHCFGTYGRLTLWMLCWILAILKSSNLEESLVANEAKTCRHFRIPSSLL